MKKIAIVFLAVCLLFASSRYVSHAGTSVPTALWNLVPTAYMEQIGIFTDPVNHRGYYPYQAYVNNNRMYSNYYFKANADNHFDLYGYEMYSVNKTYHVEMIKYGDPSVVKRTPVYANDTYFSIDYLNCGEDLEQYAYFCIDGTIYGVSVSITGTLDTY